jgi:signal transduction histidine kinase
MAAPVSIYPRGVRAESAIDLAIASVVGGISVAGAWSEISSAGTFQSDWPGALTIAALAAVPLLWRRRRPGLVALSTVIIVSTYHFTGYPGFAPALALFAAVYALAAYGAGWRAVAGGVVVAGFMWLVPTLPPGAIDPASMAIVAPSLSLGWMIMLGASNRQRRLATQSRLDRAAVEAEAELGRRVVEERLRIARDLHDVLAHTVAVISVHAGVAADALGDSSARGPDVPAARVALDRVRTAARQAMPQLRAAVEPLRSSTVDVRGGFGEIPALVDQIRAAGLDVTCVVPTVAVAPEVERTVYRVVQEALTNVVRHANARRADVTIEVGAEAVTVLVTDDGVGPQERPAGSGFGLVGMRERVQMLGGVLEAGPAPGEGFRVQARLPRSGS